MHNIILTSWAMWLIGVIEDAMSSPVPEEKGPKAEQSQECQGHFDLREGAKHFQVLTYPPYGPDLDPCDFRLFPFIKEKLAERK